MPAINLRRVVLEILRKSDGEFDGKTRLYKACYFAHLFYFENQHGILSDCDFARLPQGPGIDRGDAILAAMQADGLIVCEIYHKGPYPEYRYRLTDKSRLSADALPAGAEFALQRSVDFVRDKTATQLSQYTHEYSKAWNEGQNGQLIDIYIDIIPDAEYARRKFELEQEKPQYDEILKSLVG